MCIKNCMKYIFLKLNNYVKTQKILQSISILIMAYFLIFFAICYKKSQLRKKLPK